MGDAQVFIRTATCNCDVREFFDNWLIEVADAQAKDGAYTDVVPFVAAGQGSGRVGGRGNYLSVDDLSGVWRQTHSRPAISVDGAIHRISRKSTARISSVRPTGYGDWLNINADTPKDLLATAYFAHAADLMSRIAWIIGKPDDAAKYRAAF
jgi:alpha-L-rhamnosidase